MIIYLKTIIWDEPNTPRHCRVHFLDLFHEVILIVCVDTYTHTYPVDLTVLESVCVYLSKCERTSTYCPHQSLSIAKYEPDRGGLNCTAWLCYQLRCYEYDFIVKYKKITGKANELLCLYQESWHKQLEQECQEYVVHLGIGATYGGKRGIPPFPHKWRLG